MLKIEKTGETHMDHGAPFWNYDLDADCRSESTLTVESHTKC